MAIMLWAVPKNIQSRGGCFTVGVAAPCIKVNIYQSIPEKNCLEDVSLLQWSNQLLRQNSGLDNDVSDNQLLPYLVTKRELFFFP
jgi:hypothetical protein